MSWKPSERLVQVSLGLLLLGVSGYFLWKDTLRPILRKFAGGRFGVAEMEVEQSRERGAARRKEEMARDEEERELLERHRREKRKLEEQRREELERAPR